MGKSSPKAPAAPDPVATAQAQGQMNKDTAIANANLNRINQYTPEGSLVYSQVGTNADGTPQYQSVQSYSPEQQALYEGQNRVSQALTGTAESALKDVNNAYSTPYSTDGMTPLQTNVAGGNIQNGYDSGGNIQKSLDFSQLSKLPGIDDFSTDAQNYRNNAYQQATSRLDPQWQQQQQQLASTLAAKGVTEGSAAYTKAMDDFARQKTDAYNQANYSSYAAGGDEQSRLFGLALSGRQQGASEAEAQGQFANTAQAQANSQNQQQAAFGNTAQGQAFSQGQQNAALNNTARQQQIQEYTTARNEPINRIAALLGTSGGVSAPQFASYANADVAPVDYSGLVSNNYNQQMSAYKQQLAQGNSGLGSLFGLAGTLASKIPSDRRLKHNIVRVGELPNGVPTYVFSYKGSDKRRFGVMADEVARVMPEAVTANDNGYAEVNYGRLYGGL